MGEYRREVQRQTQIWRRLNRKWGRAKELRAPNLTFGGNAAVEEEAKALTSVASLDTPQRPAVIGTPVPLIWGYNVWVSPPALRWAYRNSGGNITSVHACSLGEGAIERIDEVYWGGVRLSSLGGRWAYRNGSYPAWDFSSNISKQYYVKREDTKYNIKWGGAYFYKAGDTRPSAVGTYGETYESRSDRCTRLRVISMEKKGHYTEYRKGTYWSTTGQVTYGAFKTKQEHGGTWDESVWDTGNRAAGRQSIQVWNKNRFKTLLQATVYDKDFETVDDWVVTIREVYQEDYPTPIPPLSGGSGGGGSLAGLAIITAEVTTPVEDQRYLHQLHIKVGAGVQRSRLREGSVGASQNYADLVWTLLREGSLVPNSLIDTDRLTAAAHFTAANGLHYNGVVATPTNLSDFIAQTGMLFFCGMSMHGGRIGLQPLLPYDGAVRITTAYTVRRTLTQDQIVSGTYERQYVPLQDRKLPVIQATWQATNPVGGKTRVREIRYAGTAGSGPYEAHDWSSFCTSGEQAEKIARYLLARRKHITHTVTFEVALPDAAGLVPGDVIKVDRWSDSSIDSAITGTDHYQIDAISAAQTGAVRIEATHFPVSGTTSLVARDTITPSYFQYG